MARTEHETQLDPLTGTTPDEADASRASIDDALRATLGEGALGALAGLNGRGRAARRPGAPPPRSREEVGRAVRRALGVAAVLLLALITIPTMLVYINPGHVGIVIHRAGGGVDRTPWGPGLHVRNPLLTAVEEYPTFMQTLVLTRGTTEGSPNNDEINVNSQEGQPLSVDVSMSFELDPSRVPALYQTFRTDIATIQHGYVKQTIRQALQEVIGSEQIAEIIGPKKAEAVARAQRLIAERLAPYGLVVKQFTLNELRAPTP
jgi:regulator of protease activity HflC (stomatin/prohibitin superfamily)